MSRMGNPVCDALSSCLCSEPCDAAPGTAGLIGDWSGQRLAGDAVAVSVKAGDVVGRRAAVRVKPFLSGRVRGESAQLTSETGLSGPEADVDGDWAEVCDTDALGAAEP